MKNIIKISTAILASFTLVSSLSASLLITAAYDGPLSGGNPKGVELFVTADIADLSIYAIGSANNGGGSDGAEFTLSGSATAGDYIYIASPFNNGLSGFTNFFGFAPTFTDGAMSINGDDAIELFSGGTVIDTFGDINVDGNGELWEYLDGWAYRTSGTVAGSFVVTDWTYSGPNAWDGASTNALSGAVMPLGAYAVPEPNSYALLAGMFALASVMIRRRSVK